MTPDNPNDEYSEFSKEVEKKIVPLPSGYLVVHGDAGSSFLAHGTAWVGGWNMLPRADDEDNDE